MGKLLNKIIHKISNSIEDKWFYILVYWHNSVVRKKKLNSFIKNLKQNHPKSNYKFFNSDKERKVEILESDKKKDTLILTCYFIKKADPQQHITRLNADFNYIKPWYESIVKLQLNGIILHDGLEKDFIDKYENEFVQFRLCVSGNYSIFEERWFAYYQFIEQTNIEWIFFTDINDVFITSNPFRFANKAKTLYIGRDNANKIRLSGWMLNEMIKFVEDSKYKINFTYLFQHVYNAGVVGGNREIMLFFISKIIDLCLLTNTVAHKDMTLVNLIIHQYFPVYLNYNANEKSLLDIKNDKDSINEYLFTGYPLNSAFKKLELQSNAIFIHK